MERDPQFSKLFRESGLVQAPEGFTGRVMGLISPETVKQSYKPLIGKWGGLILAFFLLAAVAVAIIFAEPAGAGANVFSDLFSRLEWKLPEFKLNFDILPKVKLPAMNFSTWIIATLAAIFILVLADTGLNKRGLI